MNKLKHIIAFALVLIFALSLPVSAFAATHTAGDETALQDAFNNDSDENIIITLTANITLLYDLVAKTGKVIVINGETYILKDVRFVGDTATGGGTVTVNADIEGTDNSAALVTDNNVTVKVNGDVTGGANAPAVVTNGTSDVIVTGDVTGGANSTDGGFAGDGVVASENSTVKVVGDVSGGDNSGDATAASVSLAGTGVVAMDDSSIAVTGTVSGGDNTGISSGANVASSGTGVIAADDSSVAVTGNVQGGDSTLTDIQLAEVESTSAGAAVVATGDASVSVSGNVEGGDAAGYDAAGGTGAVVMDTASVNVGGNAAGGDVAAAPSSSYTGTVITPTVDSTAQAGNGLVVAPEAHAKVTGNVTGGSTDAGDAGDGIVLLTVTPVTADPGDAVVGGTAKGGTSSDPDGENGAALYLDIGTGVTSLSTGSTANVTAWKLSDASGKMVEASDATMQTKAVDYVAKKVIYPVYVSQPKNGTITVSTASGVAGTKVTVTVKWDKDANLTKFKGIFYGSGKAKEIEKNTYEFYIPSGGGVIVYAGFDVPQTGDSANLSLWLGLMLLSSTAFAYPLLRRRKEQ